MDKVLNYLSNLLSLNDKVVIATSGGPDSMCLLHLLCSLKDKYNLDLICAHVDHNVRTTSDNDANFVKTFCETHNLIFESMMIEKISEDNFHNQARNIRYDFFESLMKKYNAKYLMTAHHADDLIETIFMRIVRGSTLKGYAGFDKQVKREGYEIIRPLMEVTKDDILEYLDLNKQEYCVDESNTEDVYTRNRFRRNIVEFLKEEDINVHEKLLKFHNTLKEHNEYFEKLVNESLVKVYKAGKLDLKEFKSLDNLIQKRILSEIFYRIYDDELSVITDEHLKLVMNLIYSEKKNSYINLPTGIRVTKSYEIIEFENNSTDEPGYKIELNGNVELSDGSKIIFEDSESTNNFHTRLCSSELELPLYVRTREAGDKINIKNMKGTKKVNDIFIDEKIEMKKRKTWPIVVDSNDVIVWIPGLKKSKFDKEKHERYDIILKILKKGAEENENEKRK